MAVQEFRQPPQPPPLFTADPDSLIKEAQRVLDKSRQIIDAIVAEVKVEDANFQNVVRRMAHEENHRNLASQLLIFYQEVSPCEKLRASSKEAKLRFDRYSIEFSMREDVFKLIEAARSRQDTPDPESQRLLDKMHQSYIRNGLDLPAHIRHELRQIKLQLSTLVSDFFQNLREDSEGDWLTATELDGVSEKVTSSMKRAGDKYWVTFKPPEKPSILRYATDAEVRRRVFVSDHNKCPQNVVIFRDTMVLRDRMARLLGHPDYATFVLTDRMARNPKTVDDFLTDLRTRSTARGADEIEALKALKREDVKSRGEVPDDHFFLWDYAYYHRMMQERDCQVDHQVLSEWFPLSTCIRSMLDIFTQLFGLVFVEVAGSDRDRISPTGRGGDIVWDDEVQLFSVWNDAEDADGFLGYLYLDLYPRDGKYGHAANFAIQPGFMGEDGVRRHPATAVVCNFAKPTPKTPSLLIHSQLKTLLHELGHGIHDLVSSTLYARFHGTNTAQDFSEIPSQMLEHWCWIPSQISALSTHYSTLSSDYYETWREKNPMASPPSKRMPDELIDRLIRSKNINGALSTLFQIHLALFDMRIHSPSDHEEIKALDFAQLMNSLRHEVTQLDGPEALGEGHSWGNQQSIFGHSVDVEYAAGYYTYLLGKGYSTDIFRSVFKADPMDSLKGRHYRHTVLEKGGSQDEHQMLKDLLGRNPNMDAYYNDSCFTK